MLKCKCLNDIAGALSDFNQAIMLNQNNAANYLWRGVLKDDNLDDIYGALTDYNKAISLDPKYADAYFYRGILNRHELNYVCSAIQDFRQAARLYLEEDKTEEFEITITQLKELGANFHSA